MEVIHPLHNSGKIKVLNKHFAAIWTGSRTPRIEPNPFEMTKHWCLLDAKGPSIDLPYISYSPDHLLEDICPDLFRWRDALCYQNPPSKVNFRTDPGLFRELVEPLDFSKPYDPEAVQAIHARFSVDNTSRRIDAQDLIDAELGSEEV